MVGVGRHRLSGLSHEVSFEIRLSRPKTGDPVLLADGLEFRGCGPACCCDGRAAGMEVTAARKIDRTWDLAFEHEFWLPDLGVGHWNRRQQGAGVRMDRPFEELLGWAYFNDFAESTLPPPGCTDTGQS